MAFLIAHDVSFELPNGRLLFQHLSLSLESRVTALVGPNGVGKTCFARILAGLGELSSGRVSGRVSSRGRVAYFAQRSEAPVDSVAEFLGGDWSLLLEGIDLGARCCDLSGGQWMKVRLTHVLNGDADFLILDEPTNDLDRSGREAVAEFLRAFSGGVLLISHDRELLSLCEDVVEFSNRGVARYGLGWGDYVAEKDRERAGLETALDSARRDRDAAARDRRVSVERQEKRTRQGARDGARGGLPKILIGARKRQAQKTSARVDVETLARSEAAVSSAYEAFAAVKVDPVMYAELVSANVASNALVAEARAFNVRYRADVDVDVEVDVEVDVNGNGNINGKREMSPWVFASDLDFSWRGPIRVAIRGPNGSGKSTLLRAMTDSAKPSQTGLIETRGEFVRGSLPVLYVDQKCAILDDNESVLENVRGELSETELRNGLAKFLFTGDRVFQKVGSLSGGERLRAALAKGFLRSRPPGLLVLDEPTNNLDIANVEFLENLLREYTGAIVAVSHDEVFLENAGIDSRFELASR